jgi:hypothetical protein
MEFETRDVAGFLRFPTTVHCEVMTKPLVGHNLQISPVVGVGQP